jgi:hypothetical protein
MTLMISRECWNQTKPSSSPYNFLFTRKVFALFVGANTFRVISFNKPKIKIVKSERFTCQQARQIDLVNYLDELGHHPAKTRNQDYWYLSPLRDEKNASFKVNRKVNRWFDHGSWIGGNLIDFGVLYFKCSVQELLSKLNCGGNFHFQQQLTGKRGENQIEKQKIKITDIREIRDPWLREYLGERKIPLLIANRYCTEVEFKLYGKNHVAIGFKNDAGGYELRNRYFKGSNSPKEITTIKTGAECLSVFEGFFDFLSFQTRQLSDINIIHTVPKFQSDFQILNTLAFFEKSREIMENYSRIRLYLDRDDSGIRCTERALIWSEKYVDESKGYQEFKDLNESLIGEWEQVLKQSRG